MFFETYETTSNWEEATRFSHGRCGGEEFDRGEASFCGDPSPFQTSASSLSDRDQQQQPDRQQEYREGLKYYERGGEETMSSASGGGWAEASSYSYPFDAEPPNDSSYNLNLDPRTVHIPSAHTSSRHASYSGGSEDDDYGSNDGGGGGEEMYGGSDMERRERRKATNRASAKAFRLRRKILLREQQESLEARDAELTQLQKEAEFLRYDNDLLRSAPQGEETIYEDAAEEGQAYERHQQGGEYEHRW